MKKNLIKIIRWPAFTSLVLLIVLLIFNQVLVPGYFTKTYVANFLGSNGPMIIACIGLSVVLINGGMDISVGAMMGLINVIFVTCAMKEISMPVAIIICLACGLACGLLNALFVGVFRVTPILTTFATSYIFNGIALYIMPSPTGTIYTQAIKWFYLWGGGIAAPALFIIIAVVAWLIVKNTRLGTYIYAIGHNKESAYTSGIPVYSVNFFSYAFAGVLYTLASIAMTMYCSGGDSTMAEPLTMKSIAACVIGGVLLIGGVGDALGASFGAISLGLAITTILALVRSTYYQNFATGILMLVAVLGCTVINRVIKAKTAGKREVAEDEK